MPKPIKLGEASKISRLLAEGKSVRETAKLVKRSPNAVQDVKARFPDIVKEAREKYQIRVAEELNPSIEKIVDLRDNGKSEQVQLASAKTLIDEAKDQIGTKKETKISMVFNLTNKDVQIERDIVSEQ